MSHKYTQTVAFILALTLPFSAVAAGMLRVENSIAGLGLDVAVSGGPASANMDIVVTDPDGVRVGVPLKTDASGNGTATVPGTKTEAAGTYAVEAQQGGKMIIPVVTAHVEAESVDPWTSAVQSWTPRVAADGYSKAEITVTLRDRYGNPLAGRPVAVVSSRAGDLVEAVTPQTDGTGVQHFALITDEPGTIQLRAIDLLSGTAIAESAQLQAGGGVGGEEFYAPRPTAAYPQTYPTTASRTAAPTDGRFYYAQITPGFDVIDRFVVELPAQMRAGEEAQKFTVRAVDRNGMTVENYMGTVLFSSTDPDASFPSSYTFKDRDLGEKSFPLALKFTTGGMQTFRVEDANDSRIMGSADVEVGGGAVTGANQIQLTSHKDGDYVSTLTITVEGRGPRYANLKIIGGAQDAFAGTDDTGFFSVPVQLNPAQRDFTLRVMDEAGRGDSGSIHLILDQTKPAIGTIQFAPENPQEGDKVLVVVESEPNLAKVMLRLPEASGIKEYTLSPNPTQSGSYQTFFTAPAAETYQAAITAQDSAGNIEEVRTQLAVGAETLPQVQNVRAQPRVDAVELLWDAVPGDVSGYRIYIGDSPANFLYTLDTGRAITKATVKGLTPGQNYVFAVTALRGETESEMKSEPVQSRVLGFNLEVRPENGALNVQWTSLSTDLPLSTFFLEYGTEENSLTENRMLNGELRDYTIRDLLNGIPYYVRVTPITVAGDKLEELAASGVGTPSGTGFNPAPRDDIPFDTTRPGGMHGGAPLETPSTGIPAFAWMLAAALGVIGVLWRIQHRRHIRRTAAFLQAVQSQYRQ